MTWEIGEGMGEEELDADDVFFSLFFVGDARCESFGEATAVRREGWRWFGGTEQSGLALGEQ